MSMTELLYDDLTWCVKRLPKEVKELMQNNPNKLTLAGGYIRSRITNEPVNDIDLFSPTREDARRWAHELINVPFTQKKEEEAEVNHKRIYVTDNAYSVRLPSGMFVQFIHRWTFDTPYDVIPSFDFTIAQAAIWYMQATNMSPEDNKKVGGWVGLCSDHFYQDLAAKRLVYTHPVRNEDAGGSILRVLKFYQRGYRIPLPSLSGVIARLIKDIDSNKVLKEACDAEMSYEERLDSIICGLLREVDPNTPIDGL